MSQGLGVDGIGAQSTPMSPDQIKRFLSQEIQNAMFYIDSSENISSSRYRNWEYYRGVMADLPTLKGQSTVVSSEVSDYIQMMLPSLLRPFTSGDKIWNYAPSDEAQSQVATLFSQYVNQVVFRKDNRGEIILNNWAFDALVQKNGVVKVWWEESKDIKDQTYDDLNDGQYAQLGMQLGTNQEITGYENKPNPQIPGGALHSLSVRTTTNTSHCQIAAIPIEEFVISRDARDYDDAVLKCHRTWEFAGKLIEDGYDPAVVNRLPTYSETRSQLTRPGTAGREQNRQNIGDPAMRKVMVYEGIVKCNYMGDGVRPWYFKAGGVDGGVELLEMEPHECQMFFAEFCPEPIPHQFVGTCPGDRLAQIQKVNTVLIRQFLQGMYLSNAPQREVVANNILSPEQLNNYAPGANIMVTQAGSVNNISLPFTANYAFEAIAYFDSKAADRVGVSRTSGGLDPDQLQNQSALAANLAWNASMGRVEMVAKIWAYTGMRQLGEAIKKILIMYQDFPRTVMIDGKPVKIDPAAWSQLSDMEVTVSTGLGTGHRDRDMAGLMNILGLQKEWIAQVGPSEIVGFDNLSLTCQKIVECVGISAPEGYFGTVGKGWAPNPPAPPQPSPDAVIKAQTDLQTTQAQERTKQADIQAKSGLKLREQDIQAMLGIMQGILEAHDQQHEHKMAVKTQLKTAYNGAGA